MKAGVGIDSHYFNPLLTPCQHTHTHTHDMYTRSRPAMSSLEWLGSHASMFSGVTLAVLRLSLQWRTGLMEEHTW